MVSPSSMCVYYVFLQPRTFLIGRMEIHCENVALKHMLPVPSSLTSYRRTTRTHRRPSPNLATSVVSLSAVLCAERRLSWRWKASYCAGELELRERTQHKRGSKQGLNFVTKGYSSLNIH